MDAMFCMQVVQQEETSILKEVMRTSVKKWEARYPKPVGAKLCEALTEWYKELEDRNGLPDAIDQVS